MTPYYQDEFVTLYHGDCKATLSRLPKVDLVLTDPPYVVGAKGCGLAGDRQYLKDITSAKLDEGFDISLLRQFPNWFCFCGKQQLFDFAPLLKDKTWMLLTWNKPNPTPLVNNNYLPDVEYIFHCWTAGRLFGTYADKSRFIQWPVEKNLFAHPTVKPVSLVTKCLVLGSQIGELVLDPFAGSGTTLVAAKQLRRRAIGIEIEEKYCEIAAKRCEMVQPSFFDAPVLVKETQGGIFG